MVKIDNILKFSFIFCKKANEELYKSALFMANASSDDKCPFCDGFDFVIEQRSPNPHGDLLKKYCKYCLKGLLICDCCKKITRITKKSAIKAGYPPVLELCGTCFAYCEKCRYPYLKENMKVITQSTGDSFYFCSNECIIASSTFCYLCGKYVDLNDMDYVEEYDDNNKEYIYLHKKCIADKEKYKKQNEEFELEIAREGIDYHDL